MKNLKTYLLILTSIIIALLYYAISPYRTASYDFNLKLGEISDRDINAPFDFSVYKDPETLRSEQENAATKVRPVYKVSENLKFNSQKNLDFIFQHFTMQNKDIDSVKKKLMQNGYELSEQNIAYLLNDENRQNIYNTLSEKLDAVYNIGIYPNSYKYQFIKIAKFNRITTYKLARLYSLDEVKKKLSQAFVEPIEQDIVREITNSILIENIVIDEKLTDIEREKAKENIPVTIGKVQKNEQIIGKNHKVTNWELLKLSSLENATNDHKNSKSKNQIIVSAVGVFLTSLFLLVLFQVVLETFFHKKFSSTPRLIVILSSFLITIILTVTIHNVLQVSSLLIPFSFSVLLVAVIFTPHIGILFNFFSLIFISLFLNWSIVNPIILSLGTFGGIVALKKLKNSQEYYPQAFYLVTSFFLIISFMALIRIENISTYFQHLIWGMGSCILSITGFVIITPIVERKLNMATKQILMELQNFDNPLMQKVAKLAPGTYHHSIIVGNLAESAAEAIGANFLLARVGSYYHDIGKIENPQFFIENNSESDNIHDKMMANESARVIKKHINDGVSLAKKFKLPQPVTQIIRQHHGTSLIKFFHNRAIESNLHIDEADYRYDGPKPQTKEAAIVMIADIVESTTKSLTVFNEIEINKVLNNSVKNLINEKQLDEAPITLKELEMIKTQMLPILLGVYRKRLEYPEQNTD